MDFHVVSKQTFKIMNVIQAKSSSFIPLTFDDLHFTCTKMAIHSAIIDLSLISDSKYVPRIVQEKIFDQNNNRAEPLKKPETDPREIEAKKKQIITEEDIENLYEKSVSLLVKNYERLRGMYTDLRSQCWLELLHSGYETRLSVFLWENHLKSILKK